MDSAAKKLLAALALAAFGIGTTEFVIIGLLPDVALISTSPDLRRGCWHRLCARRRVQWPVPA